MLTPEDVDDGQRFLLEQIARFEKLPDAADVVEALLYTYNLGETVREEAIKRRAAA